jgi:hypothetical protein
LYTFWLISPLAAAPSSMSCAVARMTATVYR